MGICDEGFRAVGTLIHLWFCSRTMPASSSTTRARWRVQPFRQVFRGELLVSEEWTWEAATLVGTAPINRVSYICCFRFFHSFPFFSIRWRCQVTFFSMTMPRRVPWRKSARSFGRRSPAAWGARKNVRFALRSGDAVPKKDLNMCKHTHIDKCIDKCIRVYEYIYRHICPYIYIYIHMYIYI